MGVAVSYRFFSVWRLPETPDVVWPVLTQPGRYGAWWPAMTTHSFGGDSMPGPTPVVVRGFLPSPLRYVLTLTRSEEPEQLFFAVSGGLSGTCRVAVVGHDDGTDVLTFWDVRTTESWPRVGASAWRWLLAWNHNRVMLAGERGLRTWLKSKRLWADRPNPVVLETRMTVQGDFRRGADAPAAWRSRAA